MYQLVVIGIMLNSPLPSEHLRTHELWSILKPDYNDLDFQKDLENLIQQCPPVRDVNRKFTQDLKTTSLSVRDVLITVVSADRIQGKPRADQNIQVVDFAFDDVSRPLFSRVSAAILGSGFFAMFILTFLEQISRTLGYISGTAGVIAAIIYATFYNLYQRISPPTP